MAVNLKRKLVRMSLRHKYNKIFIYIIVSAIRTDTYLIRTDDQKNCASGLRKNLWLVLYLA